MFRVLKFVIVYLEVKTDSEICKYLSNFDNIQYTNYLILMLKIWKAKTPVCVTNMPLNIDDWCN